MKRLTFAGIPALLAMLALWAGLQFAPQAATAAPAATEFGNVVSTTSLRVGTKFKLTKMTRVVVTDGSTITPLGTNQPISSTANTGTSAIAAGVAGDVLYLVNVGSSTITLTDTGTLKLGGNRALGVTDGISLMYDGTNWVETAFANN